MRPGREGAGIADIAYPTALRDVICFLKMRMRTGAHVAVPALETVMLNMDEIAESRLLSRIRLFLQYVSRRDTRNRGIRGHSEI